MSPNLFLLFIYLVSNRVVKVVVGGFVINRAYPIYFLYCIILNNVIAIVVDLMIQLMGKKIKAPIYHLFDTLFPPPWC